MSWKRIVVIALLAVSSAVSSLSATEHRGTVRFGSLLIPGVTITATKGDETFTAVTDGQGVYVFPNLSDGLWTMTAEMQAFAPEKKTVGMSAALNNMAPPIVWELKMLPLNDVKSVTVNMIDPKVPPPAPAGAGVTAAPSTAFRKAEVKENPNASKTPARTAQADQAAAPPGGGGGAEDANQTQNAADAFLINGSTNNGAASPFGMSGAFGNNRRGARSLYNGNIGLVFDNSRFDARNYSLTGQDTDKPDYNRMTGLFSFGGPLRIPHLLRNGPNLSLNYQWTRNRNASVQQTIVPDANQRAGNFSSSPTPIVDPLNNNNPFQGNIIRPERINQAAKVLLGLYPQPNFTSPRGYNYQIPLVSNLHVDSFQGRFNKGIGRMNQLSGNVAFQSVRQDNTNILGFLDTTSVFGITSGINWVHRFTPRVFLTTGYTYSRQSTHLTPFFTAIQRNISAEAGITGNNQEPGNFGPPTLSFSSGIASLSDGVQSLTRNQTHALSGSLFWSHSPHNITVGGDFKRLQNNVLSQDNPRGKFTFNGQATGNDFAGFLLGIPDSSELAFGNADKYFRNGSYDAYFSDDWRLGPGLSLKAGLRWEYSSPLTEKYGRLVNLAFSNGFSNPTPYVLGPGTGVTNPDKHGIQPRLGFAWHPILASSLVVRGGYSINYDTSVYNSIATQMAQQSPLSKVFSVSNTKVPLFTLTNGFNLPPGVTNTFAVDPNFLVGYAQNWELSAQRDLPGALIVTTTYNGIKGTRGRQQFLPNTYPQGVSNPCATCPSGYSYLASNGNSTRHSGNIQIRRRLHHGLGATLQYTYSKSIDDATLGGRAGSGGGLIAQDWRNLAGERALSNFDQRHLMTVNFQYSTGVGAKGGTLLTGWRGALYKDWTITSTVTKGSGLPLTPSYLRTVVGTGVTGPIRPHYTGADVYAAPPGAFLNFAAYTAPLPGQWGDAGRNSITGPGQFFLNAQMLRTFRVNDRVNADLRIDASNLLNHVTFQSWNTAITSPQLFGLAVSPNSMRTVQTTFRLRF